MSRSKKINDLLREIATLMKIGEAFDGICVQPAMSRMFINRSAGIAAFLGASVLALSAPTHQVLKFRLAGSQVGANTYDETADGHFTSSTTATIGTLKITSEAKGQWIKGKLASITIVESRGPNASTIVLEGGQVKFTSGGKTNSGAVTYNGDLYYSDLHPQLLRNAAKELSADASTKLSILFIGLAKPLDVSIKNHPSRNYKANGKDVSAKDFNLDLPTVAIEYIASEEGGVVGENVPAQSFQFIDSSVSGLKIDPMEDYPELSQPKYKTKSETKKLMPMRDGVELAHDLLRPDADGQFPAILVRTPYGRGPSMAEADFYASRGYVFVSQDVRGRGDSKGLWDPFVSERQDGYDTIQWIAKQPWCNGKVGMIGGSYLGYVQWAAAVEQPPALKCIVPQVSPPDAFTNIPYEYGTFTLYSDLWWLNVVQDQEVKAEALTPKFNGAGFATLPLSKVPKAVFGKDFPLFQKWLDRDDLTKWKGFDIEQDLTKSQVPALNISGWWDGDGIGTKLHWETMRAAGRKDQWLILGPWIHAFNTTTKFAEDDYGTLAHLELNPIYLRWFDTWLKDKQVGLDQMPKTQVFVTGENRWHSRADFPEPEAKPIAMFLVKKTLQNDLATSETEYTYDPGQVADLKEMGQGAQEATINIAPMLKTKSGAVFQTAPFPKDEAFEGPFNLELYYKADVVCTDFYSFLYDYAPDGRATLIGMIGKTNTLYLNGNGKPEKLTPGQIYKVTIRPWNSAHRFAKGHRLGLLITSSDFPGTARNLNTGEPIASATKYKVAHITILTDKDHPSKLTAYQLP